MDPPASRLRIRCSQRGANTDPGMEHAFYERLQLRTRSGMVLPLY